MNHLKQLFISFILLILTITVFAQVNNNITSGEALKIGDTFISPSAIQLMRGPAKTLDLQKLTSKVVILDFFDTYCGTCIQSMPKLQKLQDKLKDKVQIISVTWQDKSTLDKFFAANSYLKENKVNLPVIFADVYLKQRFPHQSVPHVVFLYKEQVKAITSNKLITEENITELYEKGTIDLPLKDDFGKGDLMEKNTNNNDKEAVKFGVWISGYQNGVPFESLRIKKDSLTNTINTSFYNASISNAIKFIWAKISPAGYVPRPERLVLKVKNPDHYQDIAGKGEAWSLEHALSYERKDKILRADSTQARLVLNDLHSFLGIRSYRTMKKIPCLILQPGPLLSGSKETIADGMVYENSAVLAVMTDLGGKFPPILDRVNSKEKIKITPYETLAEFNSQLAAYGIEAVLGEEEMEVLVIEEIE